mmetsp:Transcript_27722/g.89210  ORF Transcript_27722/g.89210 Transcript_27722/m.89210 type:complete len:149 (+) Transcript_27722:1581-2027(+)
MARELSNGIGDLAQRRIDASSEATDEMPRGEEQHVRYCSPDADLLLSICVVCTSERVDAAANAVPNAPAPRKCFDQACNRAIGGHSAQQDRVQLIPGVCRRILDWIWRMMGRKPGVHQLARQERHIRNQLQARDKDQRAAALSSPSAD